MPVFKQFEIVFGYWNNHNQVRKKKKVCVCVCVCVYLIQ